MFIFCLAEVSKLLENTKGSEICIVLWKLIMFTRLVTGTRLQIQFSKMFSVQARTVVRSGGLNFDWDEKFQLDLLNNMEVEFLIYSWDPQLRHRLCYRLI